MSYGMPSISDTFSSVNNVSYCTRKSHIVTSSRRMLAFTAAIGDRKRQINSIYSTIDNCSMTTVIQQLIMFTVLKEEY